MANLIEILANKAVDHCAIKDDKIRATAVEQTIATLGAVDDRSFAAGTVVATWDDEEKGALAGIIRVSIAQVDVVVCNAHDGRSIEKVQSFSYCTTMDEIEDMGSHVETVPFDVAMMKSKAHQTQTQLS